jgi:tetratricopeptide (TPR) repeat protein
MRREQASSRLEPSRALAALRKEWITPEQFWAILRCGPGDGSQLERLKEEGVLSPSRLAELYGSTVLLAPKETLTRLAETHLKAASADEPLMEGDWIAGRYRILHILKGGFGRVYLCEAKTDARFSRGNSLVALKSPLSSQLQDGDALARFQAEASHWIALGAHPNLVLAYGLEEHHRLPFVVMECVEGARTLHHEILDGRMNWTRVLWIALDVARGLSHAERTLTLVHGDLKPLNLLMAPSGSVKIADFGLSIRADARDEADANVLAGTAGFLAPEMFLESPLRTTATDMYAYGATLFFAATGRMPFPDGDPCRNCFEAPPDPRDLQPDLPGPLAETILACLAMDPQRRPTSFHGLLRHLENLHSQLLGTKAPPSPAPDAPLHADAQTNLAVSLLNLGSIEEAEAVARQALRAAPDHWKAFCALGDAQLRQGDPEAALASFRSAHRLAPGEAIPALNAALAARQGGDEAATADWLERALSVCLEHGRFAELDAASLLLVEGLPPDTALDLLDRILSEDPAAVMTWNNRAILLRRQGRAGAALDSCDRALAIHPVYAKAWSNRANALIDLRRFSEALDSAKRALELDPRMAGAYAAKGTALAQLGRLADAQACVQNGLRILPGDPLLLRAEKMFAAR